MNDTTVVIVVRNFLTPLDEILLTGRSDDGIQSTASISNMANSLHARANEIQGLNTENSSLQRMLHESQQEISNEKILGDHERLMAKLKRRCPLPSKASRT
ncbi:unnamed protein product [Prunus armeniaca]